MMKNVVLAVFFMMFCGVVLAAGDNVRDKNPVFDSDGNLVGIVTPLRCTQLVNLESGETGWFCPDDEKSSD